MALERRSTTSKTVTAKVRRADETRSALRAFEFKVANGPFSVVSLGSKLCAAATGRVSVASLHPTPLGNGRRSLRSPLAVEHDAHRALRSRDAHWLTVRLTVTICPSIAVLPLTQADCCRDTARERFSEM